MFNRGNDETKVEKFKNTEDYMPKVLISPIAMVKMNKIVNYCDDEIGWLATAKKTDENTYHIEDVFMFEQEVNAVTCEITPDGLAKFGTEILGKENGMELYEKMKVWGHSHVNMGVTPSGQDDKQITEFSENHDWFIRIIANKKKDIKIDLFDYKNNLVYLYVDWDVYYGDYEEELKLLEKEIDEKVKEKTTSYRKVGKKSKTKSKSEQFNLINYNYGGYYQSGTTSDAYDDGYYDAMVGLYDPSMYKDDKDLEDSYIDGFTDYQDHSGIKMKEIYGKSISIDEVFDSLEEDDIKDLKELQYYEFKTVISDFFGIEDWMYSDYKELESRVKDK